MSRTPPGPPPPPAVQRLRIRYAKRGRLRFASHRDLARALERALRRAGVPMAYSAGFSPHPKISYAGAAPTGVSSEAEYLEIGLVRAVDPAELRDALDAALPAGIDILEVVPAAAGPLADRLEASAWRIALPGVEPGVLAAALDGFLACAEVPVSRLTKNGMRTFDARAAVVVAALVPPGGAPAGDALRAAVGEPVGCAILEAVVRHGTPAVRPDDVLAGLRAVAGLAAPAPALVVRLAQGPLREDADPTVGVSSRIVDPLAPDRAALATQPAPGPLAAEGPLRRA